MPLLRLATQIRARTRTWAAELLFCLRNWVTGTFHCIKATALRVPIIMLDPLRSKQHAVAQEDLEDLSKIVQKSEPYYFDYGEYEDLWKAKTIQSKGRSELQRQLVIKVIRGIVHDESRKLDITKRLLEAVKTSNALRLSRHPNIVPVYGFVTNMGNFPSPVTPYYANGDVLHYLSKEPKANKYQIITDVANALKFMHSCKTPVIHGNLKASNVLIEDDGRALISDIGIYTVVSQSDFTTANIAGSCRWTAPEVLDPPEEDEEKPLGAVLTRETDVYAYAMTVLEIYTGKKPFSNRKHDPTVIFDVIKGIRPRRPESSEITDELWALICDCWKEDPRERPSMARVHERLIANI